MKATHEVLDLVYLPEEGQECFEGTYQECLDFIEQQGDAPFMYKIVPKINYNEQSRIKTSFDTREVS